MLQAVAVAGVRAAGRQQRDQCDQRDRGDVLEQQYGERQAAMGRIELLGFGQTLQAECGGRQRQAQAEHDRRRQRLAETEQGNGADHRAGQQHLCGADAEYRLAHQPQALGRQLKADDEKQQDHAQFGNVRDAFGIADQAQGLRPDGHASEQVTDHGPQLQALGQWDGDDCGEQEDHRGL